MVNNPASMESGDRQRQQELVRKIRIVVFLMTLVSAPVFSMVIAVAQDRAQESISATNAPTRCRFAVALPELEGPLTLGIFSPGGDLVRLLYRDAAVDSIPAGLNGLLVDWDGKDDGGSKVPAGIYHARGIVHGRLQVSSIPQNDPDWHVSRFVEMNGETLFSIPALTPHPVVRNRIFLPAARDALLEKRPLLSLAARLQGEGVVIEAEGLPILSIPVGSLTRAGTPRLEFCRGNGQGTAELTLVSTAGRGTYTITGLDQLVPLDAGALPFPP